MGTFSAPSSGRQECLTAGLGASMSASGVRVLFDSHVLSQAWGSPGAEQ